MSEIDSIKLLALCCILCIFSSSAAAQDNEAKALLNWKARLTDESKATLSSWKNETNPCRHNWKGISCDESMSVIKISLSNLGLQGTLDSFNFTSFPNLRHFDLSLNQFYGSIPHKIGNLSSIFVLKLSNNLFSGPIPPEIQKLTTLNILDLSTCHLGGPIPHEIGHLRNLSFLWLGENSLSGPIPEEIGMLSNLLSLYLANNPVSGRIPASLENLTKLQEIFLYDNNLSGPIPNGFWKLYSLTSINLYSNRLSGPISPFIGNLTNLVYLGLNGNNFFGPVPSSIGNLIDLRQVSLQNNSLSGSIPSTIGNLTKLTHLFLDSNSLNGQLPREMNNLTVWKNLQLSYNHFIGPLPQQICQSGRLFRFAANNNHFTGPIPTSLKNCSSLERIRLDTNQIVDDITAAFGVYPHLDYIDLSGNQLYGHLSSKWGKCQNLTQLIIHNNKLSGDIPPELGEASKLGLLDLSSNHLSGQIPKQLGKLIMLIELSLSNNNFSGNVPSTIGSLSRLETLELAANNFNGSITRELRKLKRLTVLNLSKNKFDESIPHELHELQDLEHLDLSDNLLIGTIPATLGLLPKLQVLNLSHNNLSGTILSSFSKMPALSIVDISYNQLEGPVPNDLTFYNFEALRNNKGLCGNVIGLNPCGDSQTNRHSHGSKKFLKIVLPLATLPMLVVGAYFIFLKITTKAKNKNGEAPLEDAYLLLTGGRKILYDDIIDATKEFDERYLVGKGSQGSVYRAELSTGDVFAVKKLHSLASDEITNHKAFTTEIQVLREIKHRNIVKLHGFYSNSRFSILVYEFLEGGSLDNILKDEKQATEFEWNKRVNVVKGVASALFHMHHGCLIPIIHRDISSKNVLLSSSDYGKACIIDFGTAKFLNPNSSNMTTFAGTPGYVAPEMTFLMEANDKCDVYSFGVLTLEIIMGRHPGELISALQEKSTAIDDLKLNDVLDSRLSLPTKSGDDVIIVLKIAISCLNNNPRCRPTMKQVSIKLETAPKSYSKDQFPITTIGQLIRDGTSL
ncbi:MDIS1-interacting receptor like kinase 2-like [Neltuma alba]|uniref:MDIS1-interacting receptor like kinase 2-like n=1 Tax=Neltuma alba TaxID=207710 RepID=UPI0010A47529|nr:MDIS1-interacting receptor like kinase 2-like [Prosopis alba]